MKRYRGTLRVWRLEYPKDGGAPRVFCGVAWCGTIALDRNLARRRVARAAALK